MLRIWNNLFYGLCRVFPLYIPFSLNKPQFNFQHLYKKVQMGKKCKRFSAVLNFLSVIKVQLVSPLKIKTLSLLSTLPGCLVLMAVQHALILILHCHLQDKRSKWVVVVANKAQKKAVNPNKTDKQAPNNLISGIAIFRGLILTDLTCCLPPTPQLHCIYHIQQDAVSARFSVIPKQSLRAVLHLVSAALLFVVHLCMVMNHSLWLLNSNGNRCL